MFLFEEINLRRVETHDAGNLAELKKESWRSTHKVTLTNIASQMEWINNLNKQHPHFPTDLVLVAESGITGPIGIYKIFNIDWVSRKAEVGWDIYSQYRRQGLGKKLVKAGAEFCFKILNLRRLECQILGNNLASIKCAINAGFKNEGIQKRAIFKLGEYLDNYLYGLTKEEKV